MRKQCSFYLLSLKCPSYIFRFEPEWTCRLIFLKEPRILYFWFCFYWLTMFFLNIPENCHIWFSQYSWYTTSMYEDAEPELRWNVRFIPICQLRYFTSCLTVTHFSIKHILFGIFSSLIICFKYAYFSDEFQPQHA